MTKTLEEQVNEASEVVNAASNARDDAIDDLMQAECDYRDAMDAWATLYEALNLAKPTLTVIPFKPKKDDDQ